MGLLKNRMNDLSQRGMLNEIPEQYIQSINNTINKLLYFSDKTIIGESGGSKSVTEIMGILWDMPSNDAVSCVERTLCAKKIQDEEVVAILKDFIITKKLVSSEYESYSDAHMPPDVEYAELHSEWRNQFVNDTNNCQSIEDLYGKVDMTVGLRDNASYFFKKNKDRQYSNGFLSDKNAEQVFLSNLQKGIKELESLNGLMM